MKIECIKDQLEEALNLELPELEQPFAQPCYFGMSIYDPLLDYETTFGFVQKNFTNLSSTKFYHPYHQPPTHPTFPELVKNYRDFLNIAD